jgi:hypothetical protein
MKLSSPDFSKEGLQDPHRRTIRIRWGSLTVAGSGSFRDSYYDYSSPANKLFVAKRNSIQSSKILYPTLVDLNPEATGSSVY